MDINTSNDIYQYLINPLYSNNSTTTVNTTSDSDDSNTDLSNDSIQLSQSALNTLSSVLSSANYGQAYTNTSNNSIFSNINLSDDTKSKLTNAVSNGTITKDQEDQIQDYIQKKADSRKAEMEALKNVSGSERKAYFEQKRSEGKPNLLNDLVSANIISQDQANSIGSLDPSSPNKISNSYGSNFDKLLKSTLDNLVNSNTITGTQEDTIINSIEQNTNKTSTATNSETTSSQTK